MQLYELEDFMSPRRTYRKLSDKIKLGHLLYDNRKRQFILTDMVVLQEILEYEKEDGENKLAPYSPIPLSGNWLELVFEFEAKFNKANSMTVYTSIRHDMKVHEKGGTFTMGITVREKSHNNGIFGSYNYKPSIYFVNELMDFMYLIKRDTFAFDADDLLLINKAIEIS